MEDLGEIINISKCSKNYALNAALKKYSEKNPLVQLMGSRRKQSEKSITIAQLVLKKKHKNTRL